MTNAEMMKEVRAALIALGYKEDDCYIIQIRGFDRIRGEVFRNYERIGIYDHSKKSFVD